MSLPRYFGDDLQSLNKTFQILDNRKNKFWQEYGYHHGSIRLRNLPEIFAIESTNFCNLKCIMCPRGEPDIMDRPLGHMSNDLFSKIVDEWHFYTNPTWFHWFGEPLMNPRLFDQIAYAKRRGVPNLAISTNATLLHARNAEKVLGSGLDTVMIAIDGTRKEVYERVRKSPEFSFDTVIQNVEGFLDLKRRRGRKQPHTILSIIVMEETKDQLEEFRENWLQKGADEILHKQYSNWAGQSNQFIELAPADQVQMFAHGRRRFPCLNLWQSVVITWNGHVVPCCYDYNETIILGDLNRQSLKEIWNSPSYLELRRKELEGKNDSPLCANCVEAPGHARNPRWPLNAPSAN